MTNTFVPVASAVRTAPLTAAVLLVNGKGGAAAPVLFHRAQDGQSTGLFGLLMFITCMFILVLAWQRLRGDRTMR